MTGPEDGPECGTLDGLQLVALPGRDASVPDRGSVLDTRPHESGVELNQVPGLHSSTT